MVFQIAYLQVLWGACECGTKVLALFWFLRVHWCGGDWMSCLADKAVIAWKWNKPTTETNSWISELFSILTKLCFLPPRHGVQPLRNVWKIMGFNSKSYGLLTVSPAAWSATKSMFDAVQTFLNWGTREGNSFLAIDHPWGVCNLDIDWCQFEGLKATVVCCVVVMDMDVSKWCVRCMPTASDLRIGQEWKGHRCIQLGVCANCKTKIRFEICAESWPS